MTTPHTDWYEQTYPLLSGHGIWLRGNEPNTLDISEYETRPFRVLIARLSTYEDVADSFTHRLLYQCVRGIPGAFPDCAYLPPPRDGDIMRDAGVPWLLGTAAKHGPSGFDVIALSNAVVQEVLNVPVMLRRSGIALSLRQRLDDPATPLILMGGANAVNASLFLHDDPPIDGLFAGESLEQITRLFTICAEGKRAGIDKRAILAELEQVEGFMRPDRPRPTRKAHGVLREVNQALAGAPVSYAEGQTGRGSVQITQGCPCFCTFCSESWVRKPMREESVGDILSAAASIKAGSGLDRVELYSFNFNMYRDLYALIKGLAGVAGTIGLKSQRFDLIASDPRILEVLHAVGKSSLTCGLEGISARMRRFLCKSLDESELRTSVSLILGAPIRELKVFLIATGREEEGDYAEFQALVRFMQETLKKNGKRPRVIFSITPLVRFPLTPLEFDPAPSCDILMPVLARVKGIVKSHRFEFRESGEPGDYWLSQVLVRARDRRLYDASLAALEETGFVYYREVTEGFLGSLRENLARRDVRPDSLLEAPPAQGEEGLWALIDTGVKRSFLTGQYHKAVRFVDSGYCLGRTDSNATCLACGACGSAKERTVMTRRRERSMVAVAGIEQTVRALRAREKEVALDVDVSDRARGLSRQVVSSVLAGALMRMEPTLIPLYRRGDGSYWGDRPGCEWVTGHDRIRQVWLDAGVVALGTLLADPIFVAGVNTGMCGWGTLVTGHVEEMTLRTLAISAPFPLDPAPWCEWANFRHTLRRGADGWYFLELGAEAIRKKVISAMSYINNPDGSSQVRIVAEAKFDGGEFARRSFAACDTDNWVRVNIRAGAA